LEQKHFHVTNKEVATQIQLSILGTATRNRRTIWNGLLRNPTLPRLPAELRLLIWQHALSSPRIVSVVWDQGLLDAEEREHIHTEYEVLEQESSDDKAPASFLRVCRESRQEALELFKLKLAIPGHTSPTWINPSHYEIFRRIVNAYIFNPTLPLDWFTGLCFLIIDGPLYWAGFWDRLTQCHQLEVLTVTVHDWTCTRRLSPEPMTTIHFSFLEPSADEDLEVRDCTLALYDRRICEVEEKNPEWERPHLRVRCLAIGGVQCCLLGEEHDRFPWF
jgi:hypothetical protein